jgi:hypothetical protein
MENLGGWDQTEDHPDFDPNLLNVDSWGVDHHNADDVHVNVNVNVNPVDAGADNRSSSQRLHARKKPTTASSGSWGESHQWSALGVTEFHTEETAGSAKDTASANNNSNNGGANLNLSQPPGVVGIPNETVEAAVEAAVAAISEASDSVTSGDRSGASAAAAENSNNNNNTYGGSLSQHLHPLGIQSSASCPTPAHASSSAAFHHQQQQATRQAQSHHQQQHQHALQGLGLGQPSTVSTAASTTSSTPTIANPSTATATQHLSSLTANFMLAQAANSTVAATAAAAAAAAVAANAAPGSLPNNSSSVVVGNSKASTAASSRPRNSGTRPKSATTKSRKKKAKTTAAGDSNGAAPAPSSGLPPFYLFDAPIELRANFMQNQRRLGLPIQHDPNSYHYGETVNGFHPHQYQLPFGAAANSNNNASTAGGAAAASNGGGTVRVPPPQLIDARHGNHRKNKGGQVKNEREQKRAQKITELIEQLRLQMEEGGWQVEARSKFHTLSK